MDNIFYDSKKLFDRMSGIAYVDTDGIIKVRKVNKMNEWLVVHADIDGSPCIIRKDNITYVGTDEDGGTAIHTNTFVYLISEKYADIVRRLVG